MCMQGHILHSVSWSLMTSFCSLAKLVPGSSSIELILSISMESQIYVHSRWLSRLVVRFQEFLGLRLEVAISVFSGHKHCPHAKHQFIQDDITRRTKLTGHSSSHLVSTDGDEAGTGRPDDL